MRRFTCSTLLVIGLAASSWGCSNNVNVTNPTNPNPTTEAFSGTLTPNGAQTFSFTATTVGTVTATLTTLSPDSATPIGLALGNWNGSSCQVIMANDKAVQGTSVTGTATAVANLCVRVYDAAGSLTTSESITVTVVHP